MPKVKKKKKKASKETMELQSRIFLGCLAALGVILIFLYFQLPAHKSAQIHQIENLGTGPDDAGIQMSH
jgi:cell division protein FtsN